MGEMLLTRTAPESHGQSDGPCVGERPATHTGVLRGIFDPREKEEEPQVLGSERGESHEKAGGLVRWSWWL